ncbi:hypothetical protein H0H81_011638 [Sphagnurus paluster]|uniref:CENP-V/GFA domain-containing protein n=1 Tax=Sphagnurus paluster TaxID=117069 RepID=A0A9P7K2B2_9AGAR|nr:hypothetical protein H0H81_011638 [Sphagnurus paluster]
MPLNGACLCGQTTIVVNSGYDNQQTSGSAFSTNFLAPQKDVTITGPVKTYDSKADSGATVSRVFCGNCGSAITHKSASFGENQAVQTGNFRDAKDIPFGVEIWTKDRWSGLTPIKDIGQFRKNPWEEA